MNSREPVQDNEELYRTVKTKHKNEVIVAHAVDVIPDPTCENPAHAIIIVKPEFFDSKSKQKNAFKLLQIALAQLTLYKMNSVHSSLRSSLFDKRGEENFLLVTSSNLSRIPITTR